MRHRFSDSCITLLCFALLSPALLAQPGKKPVNQVAPNFVNWETRTGDQLLLPLKGQHVLAWEITYNGHTVTLDGDAPFYELTGLEEGAGPAVVTAIGIDEQGQLSRVPVQVQVAGGDLPYCGNQTVYPDTQIMPVLPNSDVYFWLRYSNADSATVDGNPMSLSYPSGVKTFFYTHVATVDETVTATLTNVNGESECFWDIDVVNGPPLEILGFDHIPPTGFGDKGTFQQETTLRLTTNEFALGASVNNTPMDPEGVNPDGNKSWTTVVSPGASTNYTVTIVNSLGEFQASEQFVYIVDPPTIDWNNVNPNLSQYAYGQMVELRVGTNGDSAEINENPMTPTGGAWDGFTTMYEVTGDETVEGRVETAAGGVAMVNWEIDCGVPVFAGADETFCGMSSLTGNDLSGAGAGQWSVVSGDKLGGFSDEADPNALFSGTGGVTYQLAWRLAGDPCESQDRVTITMVDAGIDLNLDGMPGVDNGDYMALTSLWLQTALSGGYLDEENTGVVSVLSLIRARACIPNR